MRTPVDERLETIFGRSLSFKSQDAEEIYSDWLEGKPIFIVDTGASGHDDTVSMGTDEDEDAVRWQFVAHFELGDGPEDFPSDWSVTKAPTLEEALQEEVDRVTGDVGPVDSIAVTQDEDILFIADDGHHEMISPRQAAELLWALYDLDDGAGLEAVWSVVPEKECRAF
jgi:hypothetical protein